MKLARPDGVLRAPKFGGFLRLRIGLIFFWQVAFEHAGLDWHKYVVIDPKFMRPAEVDLLIGDPTKARKKLGWEPKVSFKELVHMMVDADLQDLQDAK